MKLILAIAAASLPVASGHGYVTSPRGRPWRAHEDGVSCRGRCDASGLDGVPIAENCPHCANRKEPYGVCGKTNTQSYENGDFVDIKDNVMPWVSEADISRGGTMQITTVLAVHHQGHMELRACPKCTNGETESSASCFFDGTPPLQECFDGHPFTFVQDLQNTYGQFGDDGFLGAMPDPNNVERAHYSPKFGKGNQPDPVYVFEYEVNSNLPPGEALLQYIYVTGNACNSDGYSEYFEGTALFEGVTSIDDRYHDWWSSSLSDCIDTSDTGSWRQCDCGERFWNCVEVNVV